MLYFIAARCCLIVGQVVRQLMYSRYSSC